MSTRNAEIARLMISGHSYSDVAGLLDLPVSQVTTCCTRLRERGLAIPRSRRFKLVGTDESGERFKFIGKKDLEQRGGYIYRCAHKAAQKGGSYLGLTWSKEAI